MTSAVAMAAVLTGGNSWAQTPLDPIVVYGESSDEGGSGEGAQSTTRESVTGPVYGYVGKATATGSKTATPITEIPQSVSVIGREEIENRGAQKVDEALRYTAGVFAQPFGYDNDTNWIYIRGFDATQTGVFQDGLQLFSYAFGGFYTDPFSLERIEVLRGPASVLYGGSNPGGMVNYVSKHPGGERLRYLETGINDAGNGWAGFDIGDRASLAFDYRVTGRIAGGDGYTDFEEDFQGFIAPSFTWHVDRDTDFTVLANYTAIDEVHGGGAFLPYFGTVADASFGKIDPEANFTEPSVDDYQRRQASIGYEFEHRLDPTWTLRQNFRYGWTRVHEIAPYAYGYANTCISPEDNTEYTCIGDQPNHSNPNNNLYRFNFEHRSTVHSALIDNQVEGKIRVGAVQHRLLFGADYKWYQLDQEQLIGSVDPISANDPVYGGFLGRRAAYIDEVDTLRQLGFYAQDQLRFGDGWIVTLGGRHDTVEIEADSAAPYESMESQWGGRAGIAYQFKNGLTPYASVATFFNPQIANVAQGYAEPESGQQYEVGVKYAPKWFDGLITVSLFDLTKQNVLSGNTLIGQSQVGEVNSRGIELEAKANVTEKLKLTASLAALDLKVTEDEDATLIGKQPYLVPEVQAGLALDYTFSGGMLDGVTIGGGVRYIGKSYADALNQFEVPDVTLFDAKLGYKEDSWGIDLNVTNLFDEKYVSGCQTVLSCAYGEGRVVKLKTHIKW